MNDKEILEILKEIKAKCNEDNCEDCLYDDICNKMGGLPCDIYDDLMKLLNKNNNIDILNHLKLIEKECKGINECAKCKYRHPCDIIIGYPCKMYDDLMFLLNEEKKINNRSDENENL